MHIVHSSWHRAILKWDLGPNLLENMHHCAVHVVNNHSCVSSCVFQQHSRCETGSVHAALQYTLPGGMLHTSTSMQMTVIYCQMTVTGGPHSKARAVGAGDFLVWP